MDKPTDQVVGAWSCPRCRQLPNRLDELSTTLANLQKDLQAALACNMELVLCLSKSTAKVQEAGEC